MLKKVDNPNLEYIGHELMDDTIYISVKSIKEYVCCPYCCTPSNKLHSRYKRLFQDLSIQVLKKEIINASLNMSSISASEHLSKNLVNIGKSRICTLKKKDSNT